MHRSLAGFSNASMDALCRHEWKGNVRELENEIERVVALAGKEEMVGVEMLSEHVRGGSSPTMTPGPDLETEEISDWNLNNAVDDLKRQRIAAAIRETGSKTRAAERLGIPRQSLQKMMKRLQISDEDVKNVS